MSLYARAIRARGWLARPLRERLATMRRDVDAVVATLRGDARSAPKVFGRGDHVDRGRRLAVAQVVRETADAITLVFEPSPHVATWRPGEFLTIGVRIDGVVHRRAYSICVPPSASAPAITVKRVAHGLVSSWLVERAASELVGLVVDVQGPSGRFVLGPANGAARHLVLVGGGSGITPLRAMLEHALATEPETRVTLVYGNRRPEDVIFAGRLAELTAQYESRLTIVHELALLDADVLARLLPAHTPDASYWLCGPEPMMAAARDVLAARGVAADLVHEERFLALGTARPALALPTTPQPLVIRMRGPVTGRTYRGAALPGQTLLEAGVAVGAPLPSSCQLGGCGACRVRLVAGEVAYETPNCLSADELRDGHALACVARALGPVEIEVSA